jgi:hypothetical protein
MTEGPTMRSADDPIMSTGRTASHTASLKGSRKASLKGSRKATIVDHNL